MANLFEACKNYVAKKYAHDQGKMLIHTGVVGWVLSSLAQILAIKVNDKIPDDQKTYMMLQEAADGTINILSFYFVTQSFKAVASKLVSTGKLLPLKVRNFINKIPNINEKIGKLTTNLEKDVQMPDDILKSYKKADNGIGILATTAGSILSCNYLTPVLRNQYATYRQRQILKRKNVAQEVLEVQQPTNFVKRPTMATFIGNSSLKI